MLNIQNKKNGLVSPFIIEELLQMLFKNERADQYVQESNKKRRIFLEWAGDIWYERASQYEPIEDYYLSIQRNFTENPEKNWDILRGAVETTREYTAQLINAPQPCAIIHTIGTVSGIWRVMKAFSPDKAKNILSPGDQIVTTDSEFSTLYNLLVDFYDVKIVQIRGLETADEIVERIVGLVTSDTRMIIISHVLQNTGLLLPMEEIIREAKKKNPMILVLVDGSQAIGQVSVDVRQLDCDFYAADFHKWIQGPNNTGFIYIKSRKHLDILSRFCFNPLDCSPELDMEKRVCSKSGLIAFSTAAAGSVLKEFLTPRAQKVLTGHNNTLSSMFSAMVDTYGPLAEKLISPRAPDLMTGIVSFKFGNPENERLQKQLRDKGIDASAQSPLVDASIERDVKPVPFLRFSYSDLWNEQEDIEIVFEVLKELVS